MIRWFFIALMLVLSPLRALALDSVTATPMVAYVQGTGTGLVTVRWTLQITVPTDQTVTVTSTGGTLLAGAAPPVAAGGVLRRTVRLTAGTHLVRITERLRVDRVSARNILEGGTGSFTRIFTDTLPSTGTGVIALESRVSGSGGLTLQNLELSFDDGTKFRAVNVGEALTARASISTSGRGIIRGKWEIAGPNGGFRTFRRVNLTAGGPSREVVESPALPTDQRGQYRVRFIVDGDGEGVGDPVIAYTVGGGEGLPAITLTAPAEGAALGSRTRFRWDAVAGAERYRVEFLTERNSRPLAAVETKGASATVRSFTLERLNTDAPLIWRVLALDAEGRVIAQSAGRRMGAP
jgi:hypothetical protein